MLEARTQRIGTPRFVGPDFPALTSAQRYHFEVYGFVVVHGLLSTDEVQELLDVCLELKARVARGETLTSEVYAPVPEVLKLSGVAGDHPALARYLAHPRILGVIEELIGGTVRMNSSKVIVNRLEPGKGIEEILPTLHRANGTMGRSRTMNGMYHPEMVRTMTNLTELGPDDGGTALVPGSHKLALPTSTIVECVRGDHGLLRQCVAPAGSTLFFDEAVIHAAGPIRSHQERVLVSGVYTPTLYQAWNRERPPAGLLQDLPEGARDLVSGAGSWESWRERTRPSLDAPVAPA